MLETRLRKTGDSVDGGAITTGLHNIIGTSNQVIVASGTNTVLTNDVTLSLPQDIATDSSPIFATPIVTGLTIGANTLTTSEWAFLDGQNQVVATTSSPTFVDLTLTGGDLIASTATTFNVFNTVATTVNAFGAATTINLAAGAGNTNLVFGTSAGGTKNFLFNLGSTKQGGLYWQHQGSSKWALYSVDPTDNLRVYSYTNAADYITMAPTTVTLGAALTTITPGATTFNLLNTVSTTVNAFGAATTLNIGATTCATTLLGTLTVKGSGASNLTAYRTANNVGFGSGVSFDLYDSGSVQQNYATIYGVIVTNTAGSENGKLAFFCTKTGVSTNRAELNQDGDFQIDGDLTVSGGDISLTAGGSGIDLNDNNIYEVGLYQGGNLASVVSSSRGIYYTHNPGNASHNGIEVNISANAGADNSNAYRGIYSGAKPNSAHSYATVEGGSFYAGTRGSNTALTNCRAITAGIYFDEAGASTNADGLYIDYFGSTGTAVTTRGIYMEAPSVGTTSRYGIYLENVSGAATNNVAIRTGTGLVVFGDTVSFATSLLSTTATTNVVNTTATTVNAFGAATTINIGATTGTV